MTKKKPCEAHEIIGAKVVRTVHGANMILRQRVCKQCGETFDTTERKVKDITTERDDKNRELLMVQRQATRYVEILDGLQSSIGDLMGEQF